MELAWEWSRYASGQTVVCGFLPCIEMISRQCPGDFESMFIEAENSETKEVPSVEEATGESICSALLWFPRNFIENK